MTRPLMPSAPNPRSTGVSSGMVCPPACKVKPVGVPRPNTMIDVAVDTPVAPERGSPIGGNGASGLQASAEDGAAAHASAVNKPARTHRHPTPDRIVRW